MEVLLETEEKEKLISECLKLEIELKKLNLKWRVKEKRNLKIKEHSELLNDKLVVLRRQFLFDDSNKLIAVKNCQILLNDLENNQDSLVQNNKPKISKEKIISKQNQVSLKNNAVEIAQDVLIIDEKCEKNKSETIIKCHHPGCEKTFKIKRNYNRHIPIHTTKYQCQHCQKCFPSLHNLKLHIRIHTDERPFACEWDGCGKRFRSRATYKLHKTFTHSNRRPFQCPETDCGKSFKTSRHLKNHLEYHSTERPFQCPKEGCDKRFKTKITLYQHVNYFHSDARKFQCEFENCQKSFKSKGDLKQHQRTHK